MDKLVVKRQALFSRLIGDVLYEVHEPVGRTGSAFYWRHRSGYEGWSYCTSPTDLLQRLDNQNFLNLFFSARTYPTDRVEIVEGEREEPAQSERG